MDLEFQDVSFSYPAGKNPAIQSFNLLIPSGSITAVLGPNGAGKTTFLSLILGWLKPQAGRILAGGKPLNFYSRREMGQRLALVPQREQVTFEYSTLEYVLLGRAPYLMPLELPDEEDCQIASEAIARAGLSGWEERSITTLSGGELQLVLIARALAQQPEILLLDEPSSHLDLGNLNHLMAILRTQNAAGVSVIFSTHDPNFAARLADSVVLMQAGRIIGHGPTAQMLIDEKLSTLYNTPVKTIQYDGRQIVTLM